MGRGLMNIGGSPSQDTFQEETEGESVPFAVNSILSWTSSSSMGSSLSSRFK
ncbi:MAG: hypothetical protein GWO44_03530 [Thermoplasmata archaeon]|nr:hypothetical protein [Thermoplasmata archaeon]NIY02363.1 hypothetical protein [Thermoplasmata archaeon]